MKRANLRKKEKTNGLVGAKNRGRRGPTKGKKRKQMDKEGLKQGTGRANLREKKITNGLVGAKNRGQGGPT